MTRWAEKKLAGWGRTSEAAVKVARPERLADLHKAVKDTPKLLAHGLGRSYGDEALPPDSAKAILLHKLDRLLSFDEATGLLTAEAGVMLAAIQSLFLPRGWAVPVMPGTGFVTLGGAIANDVHGKNHLFAGSFGRHVEWLDLLLPSGEEQRLSRTEAPDLFRATLGGLGLTGIIVRAGLRLMGVPGQAMQVTVQKCADLDSLFAAFETAPATDEYRVAWVDGMARGENLGRGVFERAHFVAAEVKPPRPGPAFPCDLPGFVLNPVTIGLFNRFHYAKAANGTHTVPAARFFHPLDRIGNWNRMYGKRGFHQFQAVIPKESAPAGIRQCLETISQSRRASFLAVMKQLGEAGEGLLSFPLSGYTLALDFPHGPGVDDLLRSLIRITHTHGGRVYLAKDSALAAEDFTSMYPDAEKFRRLCREIDPEGKMSSQMALRLGLRSAT
jgi:decaprenylphospho-beta-D-ribofuranose 2-oxidase